MLEVRWVSPGQRQRPLSCDDGLGEGRRQGGGRALRLHRGWLRVLPAPLMSGHTVRRRVVRGSLQWPALNYFAGTALACDCFLERPKPGGLAADRSQDAQALQPRHLRPAACPVCRREVSAGFSAVEATVSLQQPGFLHEGLCACFRPSLQPHVPACCLPLATGRQHTRRGSL